MRLPRGALSVGACALIALGCSTNGPTPTPSASAGPTVSPGPSSSPGASPSGVPTSSTSPAPTDSAGPTGSPSAAPPVVTIEQVGGMLPPWMTLNYYPTVVLYADGRIITEGPQIEIYPGPALPNLVETIITSEGVAQVLSLAGDAGLQGDDRFLGELIPDAPLTMVTVVRDGDVHTTTITDMGSPDPDIAAVAQFQERLLNVFEWMPGELIVDGQPYVWHRLQILTAPTDPASMPDPQLVTISQWPLQDLATVGVVVDDVAGYRCAVVEGDELEILRPALASANELTLWLSEGQTYSVQLHPLLPGETPCPLLAGP